MADLASLKKTFKGDIVVPGDPDYEQAIARWARNSTKRAKVVAFVKDAQDVSAVLKFAKTAGLRVAIKGGGHNPAAASSSEGGIVIDLSKYLDKAVVDADKKLAYVGGGSTWRTVDEATIKHGLVTVAGTVNHTGVGGLTVGGGYGFLTGLHGLSIDNVVEATVVTADGRIVQASKTENPDLFYGIRGGGSNFGVVTEFVFRLHPHPRNVFAGLVMFTPDKLGTLVNVLDKWWADIQPKEAIYALFGRSPEGHPMIICVVIYHGSEAEARQRLKPFFDVGPVADMTKEVPYEQVNGILNAFAAHGANYFMKGTLLDKKPSLDMTQAMFDKVMSLGTPHVMDVAICFEYVSHKKVNSIPVDETPYRRNLPGNGIILVKWDDDAPEKYKYARDAAHALANMTPAGEAYGNYAGPDSDGLPKEGAVPGDRSQIFFSKAYPKLQAIKKKYDPEQVFNKWYPITPA